MSGEAATKPVVLSDRLAGAWATKAGKHPCEIKAIWGDHYRTFIDAGDDSVIAALQANQMTVAEVHAVHRARLLGESHHSSVS